MINLPIRTIYPTPNAMIFKSIRPFDMVPFLFRLTIPYSVSVTIVYL